MWAKDDFDDQFARHESPKQQRKRQQRERRGRRDERQSCIVDSLEDAFKEGADSKQPENDSQEAAQAEVIDADAKQREQESKERARVRRVVRGSLGSGVRKTRAVRVLRESANQGARRRDERQRHSDAAQQQSVDRLRREESSEAAVSPTRSNSPRRGSPRGEARAERLRQDSPRSSQTTSPRNSPRPGITLYYQKADGTQSDEVSSTMALLLIASGDISGDTKVWSAGMEDWQPMRECIARFDGFQQALNNARLLEMRRDNLASSRTVGARNALRACAVSHHACLQTHRHLFLFLLLSP